MLAVDPDELLIVHGFIYLLQTLKYHGAVFIKMNLRIIPLRFKEPDVAYFNKPAITAVLYKDTIVNCQPVAPDSCGALYKINVNTGKSVRIGLPRQIAGPADFWLDRSRTRLVIPEMLAGKILMYPL